MKYFFCLVLLINSLSSLAAPRKALSDTDKTQVQDILTKNDGLFSALIKSDFRAAEAAAKDLKQSLDKTTIPVLAPVREGGRGLLQLKASAQPENNLAVYEKFLNPLITLVKTYQVDSRYNIFSCPMVKKSWIQNVSQHKEVRNVYATYMLECGTQDSKY